MPTRICPIKPQYATLSRISLMILRSNRKEGSTRIMRRFGSCYGSETGIVTYINLHQIKVNLVGTYRRETFTHVDYIDAVKKE